MGDTAVFALNHFDNIDIADTLPMIIETECSAGPFNFKRMECIQEGLGIAQIPTNIRDCFGCHQ
jgi:hypothetical protein